jgi:hypothetical protein
MAAGDTISVRNSVLRGDDSGIQAMNNRIASTVAIQLVYETCSNAPCAAVMTPWTAAIAISPLPTRPSYNLVVQGFLVDNCSPESLTFLGVHLEPFAVGAACGPPPDSLAHVDHVFIGQGDVPVACAGDSIPVTVQGHFDNNCMQLDEVAWPRTSRSASCRPCRSSIANS